MTTLSTLNTTFQVQIKCIWTTQCIQYNIWNTNCQVALIRENMDTCLYYLKLENLTLAMLDAAKEKVTIIHNFGGLRVYWS